MARVVRKWRGTVRALLEETTADLVSLVARSNKLKAKDPALAIFTDAEVVEVQTVIGVLEDAAEETVKR